MATARKRAMGGRDKAISTYFQVILKAGINPKKLGLSFYSLSQLKMTQSPASLHQPGPLEPVYLA